VLTADMIWIWNIKR